jgi:hypothetical protein
MSRARDLAWLAASSLLFSLACASHAVDNGAGGRTASEGGGGGTTGGSVGQVGAGQGGTGQGGAGNGNAGAGGGGATGGTPAGSGGARDAGNAVADGRAGDARGTIDGAGGATIDASAGSGGGGGQTGLPSGIVSLFPAPNAPGVCADPPLRISFSGPPALGTSGKIQVFRTSQPATPVAVVDMAMATVTDTLGGTTFNMARPVYVDGNDAVIYLPSHSLAYGQSYYVVVDPGAVVGTGERAVSITDTATWRFNTAPAAPTNLSSLTVALDGSGQFCSVQGATDALPANNGAPSLITIAAGTYHEIIHFRAKNAVTLRGLDRKGTIIAGTNNDAMNPGTATRSLVGIDASSDLVVENLTIHNLTPQGGSQAEALRLQGCDRCVVRNSDILSLQDTVLWTGRIYADNCLIAGNVDFVWGTGRLISTTAR